MVRRTLARASTFGSDAQKRSRSIPPFSFPGGDPGWISAFFLAIYLLISSVLLINLLIASMASTYTRVEERATELWAYQTAEALIEIQSGWPVPAPLTLVLNMYTVGKICTSFVVGLLARRCTTRVSDARTKPAKPTPAELHLRPQTEDECRFMERAFKRALLNAEHEDQLSTLSRTLEEIREELQTTQLMVQHSREAGRTA